MLTLLDFAIRIVILIKDFLLFKVSEDHLNIQRFCYKKGFSCKYFKWVLHVCSAKLFKYCA